MRFHPDILAAHAEFGGDLDAMQLAYEQSARIEAQAALIAELVEQIERFCPPEEADLYGADEKAYSVIAKAKAAQP